VALCAVSYRMTKSALFDVPFLIEGKYDATTKPQQIG
jgi:hypothetical protein